MKHDESFSVDQGFCIFYQDTVKIDMMTISICLCAFVSAVRVCMSVHRPKFKSINLF